MKKLKNFILLALSLLLFDSCNSQTANVDLYYKYSFNSPIKVFNKKTKKPYSGEFVSISNNDKVRIEFKDGKMDGTYLRTFIDGDTLEYKKYENGIKLLSLDFIYHNGKLDYKELIKDQNGNNADIKLFIESCNLLVNNNFNELDNLLDNDYSETFKKLKYLFGPLQSFKLNNVTKKYYRYNKSEHITGDITFYFSKKDLNLAFLIVMTPQKIKGQGFIYPTLDYEIEKSQIDRKVIKSINEKNIDEFISLTQYSDSHKTFFKKKFEKIGEISKDSRFLNTHFDYFNRLLLVQDYLVVIDNEKQVLSLIYDINKNNLNLIDIKFSNYHKDFNVLHRINGK